jgi:hypothetical protein
LPQLTDQLEEGGLIITGGGDIFAGTSVVADSVLASLGRASAWTPLTAAVGASSSARLAGDQPRAVAPRFAADRLNGWLGLEAPSGRTVLATSDDHRRIPAARVTWNAVWSSSSNNRTILGSMWRLPPGRTHRAESLVGAGCRVEGARCTSRGRQQQQRRHLGVTGRSGFTSIGLRIARRACRRHNRSSPGRMAAGRWARARTVEALAAVGRWALVRLSTRFGIDR